MSLADQEKWDQKYVDKPQLLRPREASEVLQRYACRGEGESALDLACGAGRNTIYMAEEGFAVDAVDIADIALDALRVDASNRGLAELITPVLQDLDTFAPESERYDLVVMSNFLDRGLIERTKPALKKEGLYIVETYMVADVNEKENSKRANLLEAGELKKLFASGFEIVHYDEFENEDFEIYRMKKQVIVAMKT